MRIPTRTRFTRAVVAQFENWGGLSDILLTHRDDVGDAERYGEHFAARVWIHEADRAAAPSAATLRTFSAFRSKTVHV